MSTELETNLLRLEIPCSCTVQFFGSILLSLACCQRRMTPGALLLTQRCSWINWSGLSFNAPIPLADLADFSADETLCAAFLRKINVEPAYQGQRASTRLLKQILSVASSELERCTFNLGLSCIPQLLPTSYPGLNVGGRASFVLGITGL